MASLKHATKKRFTKAKTRQSTILKGISAEYVSYRSKLEKIVTAVKSLIKQIQATSQVWGNVAKHQNEFANALLAALPSDGAVRSHAREVEGTVRQLQRLILEDEDGSAPHLRIMSALEGYLKLVQNVQNEYHNVEMSWTEVTRYQKKVDKLRKKGQKKVPQLQRNVDKLTAARAAHDIKLDAVMVRMKEIFEKHEAVFQCAHHAFWIAQEKYSRAINDTTKGIRWESMAVREHLVNIDISNRTKLPPIPRVQMLPPPQAEVIEYPSIRIERAEEGEQSTVVILPKSPLPQEDVVTAVPYVISANGESPSAVKRVSAGPQTATQSVVHLSPENPEVSVKLKEQDMADGQTVPLRASGGARVMYIPDVPDEQPASPEVRVLATHPSVTEPMIAG